MIMDVPSPVLGERLRTVILIQDLMVGEVEVDRVVTEQLDALREKRSQVLSPANGQRRLATWDDKEDESWDQAFPG